MYTRRKKKDKAKAYYIRNKERLTALRREKYWNKEREYAREYYRLNKNHLNARSRELYMQNRDRVTAKARERYRLKKELREEEEKRGPCLIFTDTVSETSPAADQLYITPPVERDPAAEG